MIRLDVLMVERGLVKSRTMAARLISEGFVTVEGEPARKASQSVRPYDEVCVLENHLTRYVSRGGLKLEHALQAFGIFVLGKTAFDFGSSTGGFCDCLLQHGVLRVFAVDVGKSQLADSVRRDSRVCVLEEQDARELDETMIPEKCTLGVMDVSFISQSLLYPACVRFLAPGADLVTLYKPQFEVGREHIAKGGIVRRRDAADKAKEHLIALASGVGLTYRGCTESPILGGDGNREELLHFARKTDV